MAYRESSSGECLSASQVYAVASLQLAVLAVTFLCVADDNNTALVEQQRLAAWLAALAVHTTFNSVALREQSRASTESRCTIVGLFSLSFAVFSWLVYDLYVDELEDISDLVAASAALLLSMPAVVLALKASGVEDEMGRLSRLSLLRNLPSDRSAPAAENDKVSSCCSWA